MGRIDAGNLKSLNIHMHTCIRPWGEQEVLVEEAVAALDAYGRGALSDSSQAVLGSSAAGLAQAGLQALGPLRPLLLPFPTPLEILSRQAC